MQTGLPALIQTGSSFSDEVVEADVKACKECESPTLLNRLGNIAFAIRVLRGKLDKAFQDPSNPQPICRIFQQSRTLDQELMAWRISVPREWETFSLDKSKGPLQDTGPLGARTWLGHIASYPELLTAKLMNNFRMQGIAIQSIEIRCANWMARYISDERPTPEVPVAQDVVTARRSFAYLKAQDVIRTLVDGICASVPFHLDKLALEGQHKYDGHDVSRERFTQISLCGIDPASSVKGSPGIRGPWGPAGGFILLGPLTVAYSAPGVPADQKRWIMNKTLETAKYIGMDEGEAEKMLKFNVKTL